MKSLRLNAMLLFSILSAGKCYCQYDYQYHPGIIITATSDTIECFVPMVSFFEDAVLYKKDAVAKPDTLSIRKIKYLANGSNVYETITYSDYKVQHTKLMWLQEEGEINLYHEIRIDERASATQIMYNGTMTTFAPAIETFVLRKNDKTYYLNDKYFIDIVKPLVQNFPLLLLLSIFKYQHRIFFQAGL
jgi:hypothetical protein